MRDEPTAGDLLETALAVLREKLVPALPAELRYDALMVANAIGIAKRQVEVGGLPLDEATERLRVLYGGGDLEKLQRRLSKDIRAGRFDPGTTGREAAYDHLWKTACAKAAESRPASLRGATDKPAK